DPGLAAGGADGARIAAARAAAMAGGGTDRDPAGVDPAGEDPAARDRFLGQARQWLEAELAQRLIRTDRNDPDACAPLLAELRAWQMDPELANLREPAELHLPVTDNRGRCAAFWDSVRAAVERFAPPEPASSESDGPARP
ncbi:MAG: hypothetical protein JWO31_3722, partial [Phycisphaerales bacterium]|nr:hypothetical protein [Phycisphaerales bacterium]